MNAKRKNTTLIYVSIALLAGVIGGSWGSISQWWQSGDAALQPTVSGGETTTAAAQRAASPVPARTQEASAPGHAARRPAPGEAEADSAVFANAGVQLTPARRGNEFLGYRVLDAASDDRFESGDIIASINGSPVEDSAAGSELLIAALASNDTAIGLRRNND